MTNRLFYGDNLDVLRQSVQSESVDLVYLDPPFNSNRNYNVIFARKASSADTAQIQAFGDTWRWTQATDEQYAALVNGGAPNRVADALTAMSTLLGENDALAYLVNMAPRLVELHRVLKSTGSLYLHCDPTMSHYLKILLDSIFGPERFRSEIVWRRYGSHNDANNYGAVHDVIFYYVKSKAFTYNKQFTAYDEAYVAERFRFRDPDGRRWMEQNLASPNPRPNLTYAYTASNGVTYDPPPNGWKVTPDRMAELDREGRLHYPAKAGGRLRRVRRPRPRRVDGHPLPGRHQPRTARIPHAEAGGATRTDHPHQQQPRRRGSGPLLRVWDRRGRRDQARPEVARHRRDVHRRWADPGEAEGHLRRRHCRDLPSRRHPSRPARCAGALQLVAVRL